MTSGREVNPSGAGRGNLVGPPLIDLEALIDPDVLTAPKTLVGPDALTAPRCVESILIEVAERLLPAAISMRRTVDDGRMPRCCRRQSRGLTSVTHWVQVRSAPRMAEVHAVHLEHVFELGHPS